MVSINKHPANENEYHFVTLKNNVRAALISNSNLDKSSIAITVKCGSFDDPLSLQGIAHFLEHMLFMGSEKYPEENEYCEFLSKHNGSYNAFTCSESTTYFFEIDPLHLKEGASRLSDFFVGPIFAEDGLDREILAVDSEFKNRKNYDSIRLYRLFNFLSKDGVPNKRFSTGNCETLKSDNIRDRVIKFWKENYNQMTLAIYGNESIEQLEDYAIKSFGRINNLHEITREERSFKFKSINYSHDNPLHITLKPVKNIKQLNLIITLPSEYYVPYNQYGYFEYYFERDSVGSLKNILIQEELIFDIHVEIETTSFNTLLNINFNLTDKGTGDIRRILNIFHRYEIQFDSTYIKVLQLNYKYKEMEDPDDHVISITEGLLYNESDSIFSMEKEYEYNCEFFAFIIQQIKNTRRWCIMHSTQDGVFSSTEDVYGIMHNVVNLDFTPHFDSLAYSFPDLIKTTENPLCKTFKYPNGQVMVYTNKKYKLPISNAVILLQKEIKNPMAVEFYYELLFKEIISEYDSFITLTQSEMEYKIQPYGVELSISGMEIYKLLSIILQKKPTLKYKYTTLQSMESALIQRSSMSPYNMCSVKLRQSILGEKSLKEKFDELRNITTVNKINEVDSMKILLTGCIEHCEGEEIYSLLSKYVVCTGHKDLIRKQSPNEDLHIECIDTINHSTVFYYRCNNITPRYYAIVKLLVQISSEPFFDELRTKKQLGYIVMNRLFIMHNELIIYFTVQSERDTEYLEGEIKGFVDALQELINTCDFEAFKESVINNIMEEPKNLGAFTDNTWNMWNMNILSPDYKKNISEIIKGLKQEDLILDDILRDRICVKSQSKK